MTDNDHVKRRTGQGATRPVCSVLVAVYHVHSRRSHGSVVKKVRLSLSMVSATRSESTPVTHTSTESLGGHSKFVGMHVGSPRRLCRAGPVG